MRNLLHAFYGQTDPVESLDTEDYVPNLDYIRDKSITKLLEYDNKLVGEIKMLDGNIKSLVYENYSKFSDAKQTLSNMGGTADSMESKLVLLEKKIRVIGQENDTLQSHFVASKLKLKQLDGVHQLITKLGFIFDLPVELKKYINQKQPVSALEQFKSTNALLEQYSHFSVFKQIQEECNSIMSVIGKRSQAALARDNIKPIECITNAGILLGLDVMPKDYIMSIVQAKNNAHFKRVFMTKMPLKPDQSKLDGAIESLKTLNLMFLNDFHLFIDSYHGLFIECQQTSDCNLNKLINVINCKPSAEYDQEILTFKSFVSSIEVQYFDEIDKILSMPVVFFNLG
jgi:hypothetical protein